MRFLELALFAAPFLAYGALLLASRRRAPALPVLLAILAALALLGLALAWFGVERGGPPGGTYIPAQLEGGRVVPGAVK